MADAPKRICDICGKVDRKPRHVIANAPGTVPVDDAMVIRVAGRRLPLDVRLAAMAALEDTSLQIRHPSCCAASGCDVCTPEEN